LSQQSDHTLPKLPLLRALHTCTA